MPDRHDGIAEIGLVGDLNEHEADIAARLLELPPGGACLLYIDSPGGNPYAGLSLMTLMLLRGINATGIITGECSSAALWPLAACKRRLVTPFSVLLFHPMKWQSDERVGLAEAAEWARHFGNLEKDMDRILADLFGLDHEQMARWMNPGRYVSGRELADAGIAELVALETLAELQAPSRSPTRKPRKK
jgi:ATP-dependent protease ClpP protease subunit